MSLVDVRGYNFIPGMMARMDRAPGESIITMDADGELCGCMFSIPRTGNITKIGVRVGVVTTTDTLKVSMQGIDESNGRNDGVVAASGTISTPASNTAYWVELNSPIAVTMGQKKTIIVEWDDFTGEGSDGNLKIIAGIHEIAAGSFLTPYRLSYLGGVWQRFRASPNFGLEYDDGTIEPILGCFPAVRLLIGYLNSNSIPDRIGIRFKVPYACRLIGALWSGELIDNANLVLYDSDGITPLETIVFDRDVRGHQGYGTCSAQFTEGRILAKDTYYRLVLLPTTPTTIRLFYLSVTDDGANKAMNAVDGGEYFHYTSCNGVPTEEADWTQTLTQRPIMGLVIDQLGDESYGRTP